jgi:hypothetical protein
MMPSFHHFGPPPEGALPPQQVRIIELRVEPWDDRRKIRVYIQVTPFLENPDLDISIFGLDEEEITHASIIGTAEDKFVFTLHLRSPFIPDHLRLVAQVSYTEIGAVDSQTLEFELPNPPSQAEES